jgi:hypothetical protein
MAHALPRACVGLQSQNVGPRALGDIEGMGFRHFFEMVGVGTKLGVAGTGKSPENVSVSAKDGVSL